MKLARAVIGANYGDEGKGLVTDYLCAKEGAGIVVRFNGGANAGHTVVTPDGRRHVFSHFGSGSFAGVPTYLSEYFIINPVCFFREGAELHKVEKHIPKVYAHPNCKVTTFADMIINQRREAARGADRHGSCGVGFAETIDRCTLPGLDLTMADLWNGKNLEPMLAELCGKYAKWRTGARIDEPKMVENFIRECELIANLVDPLGIAAVKDLDPVFEGAQGLLLDQDNKAGFPHLTKSSTGMKNVRALCAQAGIDTVEPYFVTRSYLTRHGAGPLAGHDPNLLYVDDTNLSNDWQGDLRFAPLSGTDVVKLCERVEAEGGGHLVVTHCDQKTPDDQLNGAPLFCFGPTRNDVESSLAKAA